MSKHPADQYRDTIAKRLDINPKEYVCPHEHHDRTLCVARLGQKAASHNEPLLCMGCSMTIEELVQEEKDRVAKQTESEGPVL